MEGRNLWAGLAVLALSSLLLAGTASARTVTGKAAASPTCVVHSLPSFVDQGEGVEEHSSVADIIEVACQPVYAEHTVKLQSQQLYNRCKNRLSWSSTYEYELEEGDDGPGFIKGPAFGTGPSFEVTLDNAGNATAVVWGGPSCAPGESLISAHLVEAPYVTVTTPFTVLPPRDTTPGVSALPESQVEDSIFSTVATIVQVEFPSVYAEQNVNISAEQLFSRCLEKPHLMWIGPDEHVLAVESESVEEVKLDNNGNAFVVLIGGASCASGPSDIEASLEKAPYTTYTTSFTVLSPRATI
jgi:hypothetical protein